MDDERDERNRRRHRALATQVRRALITAADGIKEWLADDPDEPPRPEVVAGDVRTLKYTGNKPPHQFG